MTVRYSTSLRNAHSQATINTIDADAAVGYIEIREGSQPANPNTAASGTLLVTIDLQDPSFGSPSSGVITLLGVPLSGTAVGTGTAGWFRIYDGADNAVIDGDIVDDMTIDNTSIATGQTVRIVATSTLTVPVG
jgi:hypothetical protein